MGSQRKDRIIHLLFDIGIIAKGIDGVLEIIGGVLLFLVSPDRVQHIVRLLTQHELSEDPNDIVANYLLHASHHISANAEVFGAIYLLWHGIVKVGLVAALLAGRYWAYPAAIIAFFLFLLYQLYRYSHTYSPELLVLSIIDVAVIALTWLEYKRIRVFR